MTDSCRHNPVEHLVYASSSSVYGGNKKVPFSTDDRVDNPVSLYLVHAGVLPKDYDFEAHKELVAMQPGDVPTTYADSEALQRDYGFTPRITLREGLRKFAEWYKSITGNS